MHSRNSSSSSSSSILFCNQSNWHFIHWSTWQYFMIADSCSSLFCGRGRECQMNAQGHPECVCVKKCRRHHKLICGKIIIINRLNGFDSSRPSHWLKDDSRWSTNHDPVTSSVCKCCIFSFSLIRQVRTAFCIPAIANFTDRLVYPISPSLSITPTSVYVEEVKQNEIPSLIYWHFFLFDFFYPPVIILSTLYDAVNR